MSSGRGIDPGEPEAMQFVITESLLSLGVIPQIQFSSVQFSSVERDAAPTGLEFPGRGAYVSLFLSPNSPLSLSILFDL